MSECGCNQDQTPPEVWDHARQKGLDPAKHEGVALFLVPDPEAGILEWKRVIVDKIDYKEARRRGANCRAFKWFPHGFAMTYPDSKGQNATVTINSSADLPKVQCYLFSCGIGKFCPNGCFCTGSSCA